MKVTDTIRESGTIHIFAWPFRFESTSKKKTRNQLCEDMNSELLDAGWKEKNQKLIKRNKVDKAQYMLYQYFSGAARDIFCDSKETVCSIYEYPEKILKQLSYYIKCEKEYKIPIVSMELHIYNHGIGIMFIQLLNTTYTSIEEIKLINDYGRRVALPYIPTADEDGILCAEEVGIYYKGTKFTTDYRNLIRNISSKEYRAVTVHESVTKLMKPAEFLFRLLYMEFESSKIEHGMIKYQDVADERMFTCCILRNSALSEEIEREQDLFNNEALLDKLYSIIYVDKGESLCRNNQMRKELMQESLYMRWSNWGTLYGVTNYSFVCITTEKDSVNDSVITPIISEYSYMISLALAQRLGITLFSEEAGAVVTGVEQKGTIKRNQVANLINLQEKYITFKNQLLILEVTKQEQGIELYYLMQKQLQVNRVQAVLDEQLERLYEVTNVSNGNKIGSWGIWLAVIAIVVDVIVNIIALIFG